MRLGPHDPAGIDEKRTGFASAGTSASPVPTCLEGPCASNRGEVPVQWAHCDQGPDQVDPAVSHSPFVDVLRCRMGDSPSGLQWSVHPEAQEASPSLEPSTGICSPECAPNGVLLWLDPRGFMQSAPTRSAAFAFARDDAPCKSRRTLARQSCLQVSGSN